MINIQQFDIKLFEKEFQFGKAIEKATTSSSFFKREILSRIEAVALSVFALFYAAFDLTKIVGGLIYSLGWAIVNKKSPLQAFSSSRIILVALAEFSRHLATIGVGSAIGLISPQRAREWFLPENQRAQEAGVKNLSLEQAGQVYYMLEKIHELFEKYGIAYGMTGGTQLGAYRHGGIIPWDDDADLAVDNKAKECLESEAFKEDLAQYGLGIVKHPIGYKVFDTKGHDAEENGVRFKYPFVDLCLFEHDEKGDVRYVNGYFRMNYAGEYYTKDEWEKRSLQQFGPIRLFGCPNARLFCERAYGLESLDIGYRALNHKSMRWAFPKKYYLEKDANGKCRPIDYKTLASPIKKETPVLPGKDEKIA